MAEIESLAEPHIAPRRNPNLIERIAAAFYKANPNVGPQAAQQQQTQTGQSDPNVDYADQFFSFNYDVDRRAIYRDADEMDSSSDEVSTALDIIADNATTSEDGVQISFDVTAEDQQVQDLLDEAVASSDLKRKVRQIFRNLAKYGDMFGEPEFSAELKLTGFRQLPPVTVWRNEDQYGNLKFAPPKMEGGRVVNKPGECAFEQIDPDTQNLVATFFPWQVVHARLNDDGFRKYGRSMLRVARQTWRKLKALEEALVIGRLTRDLMKLVFYIDTTGLSPKDKKRVLQEFKNSVSLRHRVDQRRENPFSVLTDFYLSDGYVRVGGQPMPMRTRVEAIDPKNSGQHNLTDIEFFHNKLLMDLRVPSEHLQWGQESAPGILTQKDVQYVRWLRSLQQEVGNALEQVFNLVLILNGIDPRQVEYTITWPALRATDEAAAAQTFLAYAQGDQLYMQEGVYGPSWTQKHRFNMSDEEIEEQNAEVEQRQQADLDQAQQLADQQHQNDMELTTAKAGAQGAGGSGPQDRDGQRKGDEGRDRNGKRIAPTKSKRNVHNPTGTGKRRVTQQDEPIRTVHSRGSLGASHRLMLEYIRESKPLAFEAMQQRTLELIAARESVTQDTGTADIVPPGTVTKAGRPGHVTSTFQNFGRTADTDNERKKKKRFGADIVEYRAVSPLLQERQAEPGKRDPSHAHDDYNDLALCFDLHGTLTPDLGYPLVSPPHPGVPEFLGRMKARGACLHIATGSLDLFDPEIAAARRAMIWNWILQYNLPIGFVGPKVRAAAYVDDRGIRIPAKPDWAALGAEAEKRLSKIWELNDAGLYVKRDDLKPKGEEITEWPDIDEVYQAVPRGYSSPVVDFDVHRTLMPAWGSRRLAPPDKKGIEVVRRLYAEGYQIHLSTAGINKATHSGQRADMALAAMLQWCDDYAVPYDRFVTHDDCELMFDDLMVPYLGDWSETEAAILRQIRPLGGTMPRAA